MNPIALLILAAVIGMVAHFAKKAMRGQFDEIPQRNPFQLDFYVQLWRYAFVLQPASSVSALLTVAAACLAIYATGSLEAAKPAMIFAAGFGCGWVGDSAANKG